MLKKTSQALIQLVKKRRATEERHLPFGEQPSCKLCHARFTTMTAFNAHKLMPTHRSRERWVEIKKWMAEEGHVYLAREEDAAFAKYGHCNGGRRSRLWIDERFNYGVVPPQIQPPASEIVEPASNRWPNDIKPQVRTVKK